MVVKHTPIRWSCLTLVIIALSSRVCAAAVTDASVTALHSFYLGNFVEAAHGFERKLHADPSCSVAAWGLSRTLEKEGDSKAALKFARMAIARAEELSDRDRRLFQSWEAYLASQSGPGASGQSPAEARRQLDFAIALHPEDVDAWLQRGDMAENPIRSGPYYLAALQIQPHHPFGRNWRPVSSPPPSIAPEPAAPLPACPAQKLFDGLGKLQCAAVTSSPQALAYFNQGLCCMHSYVMPPEIENSSSRDFQYAVTLDPGFAMAYWGYSFWDTTLVRSKAAANKALELALKNGSDRERRFCAARVMELSAASTRSDFLDALDGAILAYPGEVELWIWRGKCLGNYGSGGGDVSAIPFQLAAHRIQPEHPGPNHELVHLYEAIGRPLLGWPYAEAYRTSAPNMPHANHMIAHLAMRLGRWDEALEGTRASRDRSLAGFPELDPGHHIDILIQALSHEGRFAEAEALPKQHRNTMLWARMLRLKAIPAEYQAWADAHLGSPEGRFVQALALLDQGKLEPAAAYAKGIEKGQDVPVLFYRYRLLMGRLLVQQGKANEGLRLLREAALRAAQDYDAHSWGGGGSIAETWGEAALRAHHWDDAEEAFTEALAHEHGSVIGALGLQVLWEERGNSGEARQYAERAARIWKNADPGALDRQLVRLRGLAHDPLAPAPPESKPEEERK